MLGDKINHYEETKGNLKTTPAQYKSEFEWLKEVDSLALANEQLHLETAYKNFFRDKSIGFPKFKSKHRGNHSYTSNLVNGKYFASILYEYEFSVQPVKPVEVLGIDFSMPELYIDSNGIMPEYSRPYRQAQKKLAKEQRKLSHRKKGGANYQKQKRVVARLHEHIANQRKDFLHKQSRQITNAFDAVCIEDLNMKDMAQELNFGKSVSDNGWGAFTQMLNYKLAEQGKRLVKIDKWFPSSKTCSSCGAVKAELLLSERIYRCDCGFVCDRDVNAAINIKNEGMRLLA